MTIPPFPSQDLAKLVLGYLAEEQLMTAYDEFLQASPYLDALRNEYDRIFMTSLKIILAEYRAVKIYVETCKPFLLRKKLLQCSNLLDVVKLLISYVDTNKLHSQDISSDRISLSKQDISVTSKHSCDTCESLNLVSCNCQTKHSKPIGHSVKHGETSSLENSVETTALEDLPGNIATKKKHVKVLEKDTNFEPHLELSVNIKQSTSAYNTSNNGLNSYQSSLTNTNENASLDLSNVVKATETPECREKIEEFDKVLKKVCNKSNTDTRLFSVPESETIDRRVSNSSFQTFASGVNGNENRNVPVPDSSTSENSITLLTASKDNTTEASTVQHEISKDVNDQTGIQPSNTYPYPRLKPKSNEQKIKIISDIKVDHPFPTLNTATSTPLMQTIVINGTPAYKPKLPVANNNYTKDEIMAMPTIIVVPTSGPPHKGTQTQPALSQKIKKVKTKTTSSKKLLGPLVIDVSSSPVVIAKKEKSSSQLGVDLQSSDMEAGLVRTVDVTKNASVPKDNIIPGSTQISTPQVVPPVRKSSSTPRRQHIRVLDFTTPRRILHENICEKIPEESNDKSVEVIVTRSPNIVYPETNHCSNNIINMSTVKVHKIETCHITSSNETSKNSNWDADLRALAIANEKPAQVVKPKPRVRNSKKTQNKSNNMQENKESADTESKPSRGKRKSSPKGKKSKRRKLEEEEEQYNQIVKANETNIAVKPTFNIITGDSQNALQDNSKAIDIQNKVHDEEIIETPEAERLSLQNEIGAKLNISDLLETPYKQALYDIQMETPKFLGSVLPDDPISDIKIMSIPTPRFFDTPKPMQATPSYASRGTDYSSGGSYYKPDEQDYLRIPDLDCAVTSSKEVPNSVLSKETDKSKKNLRPVRKCTKNVSYKAHTGKGKVTDDKSEIASSCSDTASINSSFEQTDETLKTVKTPKTPKANKPKPYLKSETKQKKEIIKTRKSPIKKDKSNTFMKIKPRRPTPTKDNKRTRRSMGLVNSPKSQTKKKTSGKEKYAQTSAVVSAPTKSRRKSSTPRKLHCTKQINSESSVDSPELSVTNTKIASRHQIQGSACTDSDTEPLALRWSDDGSQDSKPKAQAQECEDISKIKEYIETSRNKTDYNSGKCTLQIDLIKRGFDAETAKIIERDLLDTPDSIDQIREMYAQIPESKQGGLVEKSADTQIKPVFNSQPDEPTEEDDTELSIYECNEESNNYVCYSETKDTLKGEPVTLRDAWSMEICVDDGEAPIRLRATSFNILFDNVPQDTDVGHSFKETEMAVSSISNMDKLYTPLKDHRTQCYEIFDSTLTSLDTPLKLSSPKELIHETTEIEIVVEEERIESKDNSDTNKRKRLQVSSSPVEASNDAKKTNSEAQFSFNPSNIQNIDIESVLKKLHGP